MDAPLAQPHVAGEEGAFLELSRSLPRSLSLTDAVEYSQAHSEVEDGLFSWVGIIMYLPTQDDDQRAAITKRFWEYNGLCRRELWPRFGARTRGSMMTRIS